MHPDFDFFKIFVEGLSGVDVLVALVGFISAAAFAGFWATKIGHFVLPQPRESRVSDFLPFSKLLSDGITVRCYYGSLMRVFKVEGIDLAFVEDEKVISMLEARKSWIDGMAGMQVYSRVITMRERIPLDAEV